MKSEVPIQPLRASYVKEIFICVLLTLSLFICTILFSSHMLLILSFLSSSKLSFFLICSLKLDKKSNSIILQEKCAILFSYTILGILLLWSCYLNIFKPDLNDKNSVGLIF